jgi:hypothetical protein
MKKLTTAAALTAAIFQVPAHAQSLDTALGGIDFSVHGFATAGGVVSNTNDSQFVRSAEVSGADKTPVENVDSNLGVQATARFNSWISATVQVLEDASVETDPIAWAYVKIDPISNLSLKLGKMEIPLFMISDSRDIGYANTWVRPPNEVYALSLNEELKGGEATYTIPLGTTHLSATGYAGNSLTFSPAGSLKAEDVHGGELRWESEWVTLRGSYMSEQNYSGASVAAPPGSAGPAPGTSLSTHDKYTFEGIGAQMDHDNIVAQAEWVKRTSATVGPVVNATGWYMLGGYRVGRVLPYVSYASTKDSGEPSPVYLSGNQDTKAVGVRWDFLSSADIKFQFERVDPKGTEGISFVNQTPSFGNNTVSVTTLLVDFVF